MRFAAWTGIVIGATMVVQWLFFIATGQVPEFATAPYAIAFHLGAELVTAVVLIAAGVALLRGRRRAPGFALFAFGMLVYTSINAPGYFAQLGQWPLVAMFALVALAALVAVARLLQLPDA